MGIFFLLHVLGSFLAKPPQPSRPAEPVAIETTPARDQPEQQPYLYTPTGQELVICSSRGALAEFNRIAFRHDAAGLRQMLETGDAMVVDNYERISIIDFGPVATEIRLLGGAHTGGTAFVATEFIRGLK